MGAKLEQANLIISPFPSLVGKGQLNLTRLWARRRGRRAWMTLGTQTIPPKHCRRRFLNGWTFYNAINRGALIPFPVVHLMLKAGFPAISLTDAVHLST
jgi:hypothetical protein